MIKKEKIIFLYQGFRILSPNALQLEKGSEEPELQCLEALQWYFKQDCRDTGHLVSWFVQQYGDLQLCASLSSLRFQMLPNDTARNQAALNYP